MRSRAPLLLAAALAAAACKGETQPCALWDCGGACVDVRVDGAHCGACGAACPAGQVCSGGACALACEAPLAACGSGAALACAALRTDAANCGACGVACPAGQVCADGACAPDCAPPLTACGAGEGAWCADVDRDRLNCGACGRACAPGWACAAGACVERCGAEALCDGACVDLWTDERHCGACGSACAGGAICAGAACRDACEVDGLARCGEGCADLASDAANCGACGSACAPGGICVRGACAPAACAGAVGLPGAPDLVDSVASKALLAADVDADGVTDLLLAEYEGSRIVLHRGLAAGGYAAGEDAIPVAGWPTDAADLDGDGDRDLLVISASRAAPWWNDGAGHFTAGAPWPMYADLAVAADLDGAGLLDVAAAGTGYVQIAFAGSEAPPAYLQVGWGSLAALRPGDLDGDGDTDLVTAEYYGAAVVLRNQGGGAFVAEAAIDPGTDLLALQLADADGDADLDAVYVGRDRQEPYGFSVGLLRNDAGTLAPAGGGVPFPYTPYLYDLTAADLDADGLPEAVVGELQAWRIFPNAGDGTFGPPALAVTGGAQSIAALDADRDGRVDLVAASATAEAIEIRRQLADGGWAGPEVLPFAADQVALADVDGDGRDDLVTLVAANEYGGRPLGTIAVRLAGPQGFGPPLEASGFGWAGVLAGDLDGDGAADLVVQRPSGTAGVLRSRGGGALADEVPVVGMSGGALADVTGDGALDLVDLGGYPEALRVAAGRGDGAFAPPVATPLAYGWVRGFRVADFDGDGRADAATLVDVAGPLARVYPGRPDGTFGAPQERALEVAPGKWPSVVGLAAGDLDADGRADLAALFRWSVSQPTYHYEGVVAVLRGTADGLGAVEPYGTSGIQSGIAIGSLGGGGRADVVLSTSYSLGVLSTRADGTLGWNGRWALPSAGGTPVLGDVDGDLRGDVVVPGTDDVVVYRGACRAP